VADSPGVNASQGGRYDHRVSTSLLQIGERRVDLDSGEVHGVGVLRPLERALLRYLADHADRAVPVPELHAAVWGHAPRTESRTAYTTVKRLRPLIEPDPHRPRFLLADRGRGYRLVGARWIEPDTSAAPPPGSVTSVGAERDVFVGRVSDLDQLGALLTGGARLVTVAGLGGVGKTRFVSHFARSEANAAWCDLTLARTPEDVAFAVLRAVRCDPGDAAERDPVAAAADALRAARPGLLVLDNFEQVVAAAEGTVGRWLDGAPALTIVVTSRERLGLVGEHMLALGPLSPADARHLFALRARAVCRNPLDDDADRDVVAELLALLDHLPLAIELAAARLRVLPVRDVLARMSDRFALLTAGGRRPERHATLRVTLDGSWELLDDALRDALAQLAVFVGGFDLAAAEAVLHLPDLPVLDAIQGLVDRSLVQNGGHLSPGRFILLESISAYAAERLDERGGRWAAERRHEAWFVGVDRAEPRDRPDWLADLPNRLAACRRVIARGDSAAATDALMAVVWRLLTVGPCSLASELAQQVLALPGLEPAHRGSAYVVLACTSVAVGEFEAAVPLFDEALRWAVASGDRARVGRTLGRRGIAWFRLGRRAEAEADLRAALRELDDPDDRAVVLGNLGIYLGNRDPVQAEQVLLEALALYRLRGRTWGEPVVLGNLGWVCLEAGRLDEAERWLRLSEQASRTAGNRRAEAVTQMNLGDLALRRGRPDEARAAYLQSLALYERLEDREGVASARIGLAESAEARERAEGGA
jgi:predicted ATPase/Tfp pilus assembly protein PilF/DNA-binding winged helix-turn-helix (wHTH) protein